MNHLKCRLFLVTLGAVIFTLFIQSHAWGWGVPHGSITEAALATLPDWQKQLLGDELQQMGSRYCFIPDQVHSDKANAKFAMMDSKPGVVYLVNLHLPAIPQENFEILRYFMDKAVSALKAGNVGDAVRYAGTLSHALEDWGCPAHSVPGDNMFTLFKQFLPPPPSHQYVLLHGPVENASFKIDLGNYQPRLLGVSVDEAAFNLLRRVQESTINARGQVIPIIQALYAGDSNAVTTAQLKAATLDATVVSDALYTLFCLGTQKFDSKGHELLRMVDISTQSSLEATNLFLPQSSFFSRPYWGHSTPGVVLNGGSNAVPLKLNVEEQGKVIVKQFASGIGTGTRSVLTYLIPVDVYQRFTVLAGLHAELGVHGKVIFEVLGNSNSLARVGPISGDMPARLVDVGLAGVTNLQLVATSSGGDAKCNYAIWAEPRLVKDKVNVSEKK